MARFTYELLDEQVDSIVCSALKEDLELTLNSYPEDETLISSLLEVLRYHSVPSEYATYMVTIENELRMARETWRDE